MFLTDDQVERMTGAKRGEHRPCTLRRWLLDRGFVEDVDFFKRIDGWYSVMDPRTRQAIEAPRPRVRKRA